MRQARNIKEMVADVLEAMLLMAMATVIIASENLSIRIILVFVVVKSCEKA